MPQLPTSSSVPPPTSGSADILLVDDTPSNLLSLETALGDLSPSVVRASSGAEALKLLLTRDFGLIILDVQMPTMDGLETARLIRERKRSKHTPIIFITAFGYDESDVSKAYALGAVDFLFKPILPEVLRAKVAALMELQRRTIEVAYQAEQLREHEQREHQRSLEQERERWQAEAMRRKIEELAEADRRKDEFLAMLGHELRNPLAPVLNGLELLGRKFEETSEVDASVRNTRDTMERQIRHLVRLVDDLLDVARISAGSIELKRTSTSLGEIVNHAVESVRALIEQQGHRFSIVLPTQNVVLRVDSVRLTQVLINLLTNAARYTEPGGELQLVCALERDSLAIRVVDNGQGIASALLPQVFDMFVQEKRGEGGGLGIGLALVKRLVELHDGTVEAHSAGAGQGSEFIVRLPLSSVEAAQAPVSASDAAPNGNGNGQRDVPTVLRIAVVEDNQDVREAMQDLLIALGHSVEVAEDGLAGAELILRFEPHVALVDLGMPGIDGLEVARRVRAKLDSNKVRLVATTGYGQESHQKRAREAGFDAYLIKPAGLNALQKILTDAGAD